MRGEMRTILQVERMPISNATERVQHQWNERHCDLMTDAKDRIVLQWWRIMR